MIDMSDRADKAKEYIILLCDLFIVKKLRVKEFMEKISFLVGSSSENRKEEIKLKFLEKRVQDIVDEFDTIYAVALDEGKNPEDENYVDSEEDYLIGKRLIYELLADLDKVEVSAMEEIQRLKNEGWLK